MISVILSFTVLLFYVTLMLQLRGGFTVKPPPSVECKGNGSDCEIFNYMGSWEDGELCEAGNAVWPRSEAELLHAVAEAVKRQQKIRIVSAMAHSVTKLACPGRQGLVINTENYASVIAINKTAMTITVQAGAMMGDVIERAGEQGLAVPAMIYWKGVSAAGVISTGAHGSGLAGKGSGVYEYVVSMRLVVPAPPSQGYAKVITLTEEDEDMKAARLSLGTLGAISEITFALQPMFKRFVSLEVRDDNDLEKVAETFLKTYEYADIGWVPSHGKAVFMTSYGVPVDVPGDGEFTLAIAKAMTVNELETSSYYYDTIQSNEDVDAMCHYLETIAISAVANGSGFRNDRKQFTGYPVVGFNDRMQSFGECLGNADDIQYKKVLDKNDTVCLWDRRVHTNLVFDVELRLPMSRLKEAIEDIKKIRDLNPLKFCDKREIVIRSIKKSESYLGPAEDIATFEMIPYRSMEADAPKWNGDVFEEIQQMIIEKYNGGLHWGKSGGYLFEGVAKRVVSLDKFLKVKQRFDPNGLFSNKWTDSLFEGGVQNYSEGCALTKTCKCKVDKHCAPHKGYICGSGRIWNNARVCRKIEGKHYSAI